MMTRRALLGLPLREMAGRVTRHGRTWQWRWIGRRDRAQRLIRLYSLCWGRAPGGSPGYQRRLSLSLRPAWVFWLRDHNTDEWFLTLLGVRLHHKRDDRGTLV